MEPTKGPLAGALEIRLLTHPVRTREAVGPGSSTLAHLGRADALGDRAPKYSVPLAAE